MTESGVNDLQLVDFSTPARYGAHNLIFFRTRQTHLRWSKFDAPGLGLAFEVENVDDRGRLTGVDVNMYGLAKAKELTRLKEGFKPAISRHGFFLSLANGGVRVCAPDSQ